MTCHKKAMPYKTLNPDLVKPLTKTDLSLAGMDRIMNTIMKMQEKLDTFPILQHINLIDLMQNLTPPALQRKLATKKAIQSAQYLGEHNRACIAFWREHGLENLDFLADNNPDTLRKFPIMTAEYFYTYSPDDRFSRDTNNTICLSSSGSTGKPKLFLTSPEDALQTLPTMKQFVKANWKIENYDRVEIVVHTIRAKPGKPQWGAGYNMLRLISLVAEDFPHLHYEYLPTAEDTISHIQNILTNANGKTLVVVYSCPSDAAVVVRELTDFGHSFESNSEIIFKFTFIGEAIPPYRLFQIAEWLKITEAGLSDRKLEDIITTPKGRKQLKSLSESFSNGFGSAELQTGVSSTSSTTLWIIVMYLLAKHEPERIQSFLENYFEGNPFPWSAFKTSPNVFFLLGNVTEHGEWSLEKPKNGKHCGPGFATSLAGAVVNCKLDFMHIWDMDELANLLKQETGIDIKKIARAIGIKYSVGDMILTNGRMDNTDSGGLEAAISWGGYNLYGHNLHSVASQVNGLSGAFSAQSIDYKNGERILWIHFEANRGENIINLQRMLVPKAIQIIESENAEFAQHRAMLLDEGGEDRFVRTVQIKVLPYGHSRFNRKPGQRKNKYIYQPYYIDKVSDHSLDPIAKGLIKE